MKLTFSLLLLTLFSFFSCNNRTQDAIISASIENEQIGGFIISNPVDMRYDTLRNIKDGQVTFQARKDGEIVSIKIGRASKYFYLEPGESVNISQHGGGGFTFRNSLQQEQELLQDFDKQMSIANTKFNLREMASSEPEEFLQNLDRKYEKLIQLTKDHENTVSSSLLQLLEQRAYADKAATIYNYPPYYEFINEKKPELPDHFFNEAERFDINNEKAYYFQDVASASMAIIDRNLNPIDYKNIDDYYRARFKEVDTNISNDRVKEILKFNLLSDKINYGGGAGEMQDIIEDFIINAEDQERLVELKTAIALWAPLQKGKVAPDFTAYTRDGEEIKLSQLKGKNVYIDVWATWCGPCLAEIPALKKMEAAYEGQNIEFVSVSIDEEKDKEKWAKMIDVKNLGGTQVIAENAWRSEIAQKYMITGIPRFMMIREDGTIASAEAPRPSDTQNFNQLASEVLE